MIKVERIYRIHLHRIDDSNPMPGALMADGTFMVREAFLTETIERIKVYRPESCWIKKVELVGEIVVAL